MAKQEFVDIANTSEGWNFGVYPSLLESSLYSFSHRPAKGAGFQISVLERSFASAVCALAAFQIEGMLQKISLLQGSGDNRDSILKLVTKTKQKTAVIELFVVRDVIAHGHIYKTTLQLKKDGFPKSSHSTKLTKYESKDFKQVVSRNKTKLLSFNVNPARIDFCDAVLAVAVANVLYKELKGRTKDMAINKFVEGSGYDTKYFDSYVQDLIKGLDKNRAKVVKNKLKKIDQI